MSLFAWLWLLLLLVIEAALVLLSVKIAFDFPEWNESKFSMLERRLSEFARRRGLAVLAVAAAAFLVRGLLIPIEPVPEPTVHDEFSYLLQADTFASGRLANPTHPMWVHFESMHIEHRPTYASMYPPGQGLVLALGQRLGNPFYGVWILGAVMCGSICWMLQGWLSPGWALFGAGIALIRLATFSYWVDSYMVAALTATGGALVLGAMPRILARKRFVHALILGLGIAILVNSRPYEGIVLSVAVLAIILYQLISRENSMLEVARCLAAPLVVVIVPTLAFIAYYDWRVFGSVFTLPYQINRATYAVAGVYIWNKPRPAPVYHHKVLQDFFVNWELPDFEKARTPRGFVDLCMLKLTRFWEFYIGPALTLPLLVLPAVARDKRIRLLLLVCLVFAVGLFVEAWFLPHYAAPVAAAVIAIGVQSARHLRVWRWKGRPVGLAVVRMIPLVCMLMLGIRIGISVFKLPVNLVWPSTWATVEWKPLNRQRIATALEDHPGEHLVLVRYGPKHDPFREFVYNAADIDRARIVWARDMSPIENQTLLNYFQNRQVWELDADATPPRLSRLR